MRCLALAGEFRRRGAYVHFLCREHPGHLIARAEAAGYQVARLDSPPNSDVIEEDYSAWLGVSQEQDARDTLNRLQGVRLDWVVVDHYGLDARWEGALRIAAAHVLVIDDLADRQHNCDLLLDQSYLGGGTPCRYVGLLPATCMSLLGPRFALLQPEYAQLRDLFPPRDGNVRRVLVFFGGGDHSGDTLRVLEALSCAELEMLAIDVVVGQRESEAVERQVANRRGAVLYRGLACLAGLIARADLAIGAGGSTTWERACLGLPAVVATVSSNQVGISAALAEDGYQVLAGASHELDAAAWRAALIEITSEPSRLATIARRAATLTDGKGCERVAEAVFGAHPSDRM